MATANTPTSPATPPSGGQMFYNLMKLLHWPAMWVLSKMRYFWKFTAIAIVLLLPQFWVGWLQYKSTTHDIQFNSDEHVGMQYMDPLHNYLGAQQRHWVLAVARASGHKELAGAENDAANEVNNWSRKVDAADAEIGTTLKTHDRWRETKEAWAKVMTASAGTNAIDIDKAHTDATAVTSDLIVNYVANFSNLILDPDLDSYWLMDMVVAKEPTLGNLIAQQVTASLISEGDPAERLISLAGYLAAANQNLADTESIDIKTAVEQTKNFGNSRTLPEIAAPFNTMKAETRKLGEMVKGQYLTTAALPMLPAVRRGDKPTPASPPDTKPLVTQGMSALSALDAFYDKINPELDNLTALRVAKYRSERSQGVILMILATILHFYVFAAFYFAMKDSVQILEEATARMIKGTTEVFSTFGARDEMSDIVHDFNQINVALVEARELKDRIALENEELQANIINLLQVVSEASDGNLTVRATITTGALGNVADAFNLLLESLEALVGEVVRQTSTSNDAVKAIAHVAKTMASGASNQTNEVLAARKLVEDVAKQIEQVSKNAEGASAATQRTAQSAQDGEQAVENVISGMSTLRASVQVGAKRIKILGERSMEITSIVNTISRISEQTNMLALNAAIEAARAGEHGRGFSVVADEVRKLAERATEATKDIEKLVRAISAETTETVQAIEQQTNVVEDESRVVGSAGESLRRIREVSNESAHLVADITNVARAQVAQAARVVKTMEGVSAIALETQTGAESTASTVAQLLTLSENLNKSVKRFRVTNGHLS